MTCIAAVVQDGEVWMGGDSAGTCASDLVVRADRKVFFNGQFLFGFAGSFRVAQLMRYAFEPPRIKASEPLHKYMVTTFVDAMRKTLERGGAAARSKHDEDEYNGSCLVAVQGQLYHIQADYQVALKVDSFDAIGTGAPYAIGAMAVSGDKPARDRVEQALWVAERYTADVRGPFVLERYGALHSVQSSYGRF